MVDLLCGNGIAFGRGLACRRYLIVLLLAVGFLTRKVFGLRLDRLTRKRGVFRFAAHDRFARGRKVFGLRRLPECRKMIGLRYLIGLPGDGKYRFLSVLTGVNGVFAIFALKMSTFCTAFHARTSCRNAYGIGGGRPDGRHRKDTNGEETDEKMLLRRRQLRCAVFSGNSRISPQPRVSLWPLRHRIRAPSGAIPTASAS